MDGAGNSRTQTCQTGSEPRSLPHSEGDMSGNIAERKLEVNSDLQRPFETIVTLIPQPTNAPGFLQYTQVSV